MRVKVLVVCFVVMTSCHGAEAKQSEWVDQYGRDWLTAEAYAKAVCKDQVWSRVARGSERATDVIVSAHPKGGLMVIITDQYDPDRRPMGNAYCWFRAKQLVEQEAKRY